MAFYKSEIEKYKLLDEIIQKLTTKPAGSEEAYWTQVQSGTYATEGYILHSHGSKGTEDIFVRLRSVSNGLNITIMEKYTPNPIQTLAGTVVNECTVSTLECSYSTYQDTWPVEYILSFDRDRIMLSLKGLKKVNSIYIENSFLWLGLPKAMDPNDDSTRATIAIGKKAFQLLGYSNNNNNSVAVVLRARDKSTQVKYSMLLMTPRTVGWNNKYFLSDIYLQNGVEGVRSIMHGVYPLYEKSAGDFRDGDEITIGSRRFTILNMTAYNASWYPSCFSSDWIAIEHI